MIHCRVLENKASWYLAVLGLLFPEPESTDNFPPILCQMGVGFFFMAFVPWLVVFVSICVIR